MTKINFLPIKLILIFSLISVSLSFSVLIGSYTKNPFNSRDKRFNKALTMVIRRAVDNNGGYEKVQVLPVAAYRQIVNGVNYKIITALKDEKNSNVHLVTSNVNTGPLSGLDSSDEPSIMADDVSLITYHVEIGSIIASISEFVQGHLASQNISIKKIQAIDSTYKIVNIESIFLVNTLVESEGKTFIKYLVLSMEEGKGFTVLQTFDFPM